MLIDGNTFSIQVEAAPPRTPSAGRRGRKPNKSHLLKTPHRLRRRLDQGIDLDDDSDPSFSEGSDEDNDDESEEDDDDTDNNARNNNEKKAVNRNETPAAPSLFDKKAPATPSRMQKSALKKSAEQRTG